MKVEHFIITRFNIRTSDEHWKSDKNNAPCLTGAWLAHRFELFKRYCLPSILNQTSQDFKWLVYLDKETPESYKLKFVDWKRLVPQISPIYIGPKVNLVEQINKDIASAIFPNCTDIITSRLDDDDALRSVAIQKIRYYFKTTDYTSVNFAKGYCLSIVPPIVRTKYDNRAGPLYVFIKAMECFHERLR